MENVDFIGRVIDIAPNMIGFIFAVMVLAIVLKNEWARYAALQTKFEGLQNKTIEIALKCKDEDAKAEMMAYQKSQREK